MTAFDNAEKLLAFMNAAIAAGAYDPNTQTFASTVAGALHVTGTSQLDGAVTCGAEVGAVAVESEGGIGFFGTEPPGAAAAVTGALTTVADAPAKAVLTSIIAALVATGQATNGTT